VHNYVGTKEKERKILPSSFTKEKERKILPSWLSLENSGDCASSTRGGGRRVFPHVFLPFYLFLMLTFTVCHHPFVYLTSPIKIIIKGYCCVFLVLGCRSRWAEYYLGEVFPESKFGKSTKYTRPLERNIINGNTSCALSFFIL
jgi:hypothetical protein